MIGPSRFTIGRGFTLCATMLTMLICGHAQGVSPLPTSTMAAAFVVQQSTEKPPEANPADVASMDAILAALYDVISGPAGQKRNWDRMRSLFVPGARLIPTGKRPSGEIGHRMMDVEGYISSSGPFLETNGFFEREVARRVESFGQIAHVFSTYESRRTAEEAKPFMRGINSIQLLNDGKRWWIVTVFWQAESPDTPLPEKYLK